MLKSTYKPSPGAPQPLPPGWTEHKAPTGHTYYYNASTKESTYTRPVADSQPPAPPSSSSVSSAPGKISYGAPQLNLSDPRVANAFMSQFAAPPPQPHHGRGGGFAGGGRGGGAQQPGRPRPQPVDKPRSKVAIPGCEPWLLVYTKYGRRFAYNPAKKTSFWRIPDRLKPGILELDTARIRHKVEGIMGNSDQQEVAKEAGQKTAGTEEGPGKEKTAAVGGEGGGEPLTSRPEQGGEDVAHDYDSSEYEEVEVTDDEDDEGDEDEFGNPRKRQRTGDDGARDTSPVEFTEADIAAQLAAMQQEYAEDDADGYGGDGGDGEDGGDGGGGDEMPPLSERDARELFKDLLNDLRVSPYSPWDKVLEDGALIDDPRYTVLPTTKARRDVWDEWSRQKIADIKAQRAAAAADEDGDEKPDPPQVAFMELLHAHATPKLYWPEFRRKHRREPSMRDAKLSDRDRERWYRDVVARLRLPAAQRRADLARLLDDEEVVPRARLARLVLRRSGDGDGDGAAASVRLPAEVRCDVRYVAVEDRVRDEVVEGFMRGLREAGEGEKVQKRRE